MKRNLFILIAVLLSLLTAHSAWALNEECVGCHPAQFNNLTLSNHSALACATCHEGAAIHLGNHAILPKVHFDLELCGTCHPDQYRTYIYGDSFRTKYGGSPYLYSKLNDFAHYNDIIDGYGFTKEYNEERSHNVMLKDHYDITRGKYETCLQCKSTKVAYYWDSGRERVVLNDTYVKGGQMQTGLIVPSGTKVTMKTARDAPYPYTHEAQVLVTLPDGTKYSSFEYPGATKNATWTWAGIYALAVNELAPDSPTKLSGNGCNHCHNPHRVARDAATGEPIGFRIIRKSLIYAIGNRGINPYISGSTTSFDGNTPLDVDKTIALCGQCHVEYVCGRSSIDGIDRDYFPWAKVYDLEGIYNTTFPGYGTYSGYKYVQDWVHGSGQLSSPYSPGNGIIYNTPYPIQEELVKSQHPEAETYWKSRHYENKAPCYICHMPRVTKVSDGSTFTSHWLASPLKYMNTTAVGAFASEFNIKLDQDGIIPPCGACHGGTLPRMKTKAERIQDDTYASALTVQSALVASLKAIKAAKDAQAAGKYVNITLLESAIEDHRAAHIRWENLIVSENSMGFHNPAEVNAELKNALTLAQSAKQKAEDALKVPRK